MDKTDKCYLCEYFNRYYTKGVTKFNQTKYGWCGKNLTSVSSRDGCESYVYRKKHTKISGFVKYYLNGILTELSMIRNIIEEDD